MDDWAKSVTICLGGAGLGALAGSAVPAVGTAAGAVGGCVGALFVTTNAGCGGEATDAPAVSEETLDAYWDARFSYEDRCRSVVAEVSRFPGCGVARYQGLVTGRSSAELNVIEEDEYGFTEGGVREAVEDLNDLNDRGICDISCEWTSEVLQGGDSLMCGARIITDGNNVNVVRPPSQSDNPEECSFDEQFE